MLSKFFRKRPHEGKPLALGGLAAGLAAMDNAWATLDCLGGSVQWNHGRPMIVPPGSGGSRLDHSFLPRPSTTEGVWFDVTGGFVLFDGAWESVEAFTIDEDETDTHWWLEIDDASETVDITVESGEAWPTDEGLKFIRLFEFGEAGVLSSITRHATNDVVWTGDDIRGTEGLFKAVTDRAYLTADDSLVSEDTAFNGGTMYLYKTWDYIRWPEPES
jgi:hypothetical protein